MWQNTINCTHNLLIMKDISYCSTYVMGRTFKWLHMWRNFSYLHICQVKKFEISPHDRFFSTGTTRGTRDKYQVCFIADHTFFKLCQASWNSGRLVLSWPCPPSSGTVTLNTTTQHLTLGSGIDGRQLAKTFQSLATPSMASSTVPPLP